MVLRKLMVPVLSRTGTINCIFYSFFLKLSASAARAAARAPIMILPIRRIVLPVLSTVSSEQLSSCSGSNSVLSSSMFDLCNYLFPAESAQAIDIQAQNQGRHKPPEYRLHPALNFQALSCIGFRNKVIPAPADSVAAENGNWSINRTVIAGTGASENCLHEGEWYLFSFLAQDAPEHVGAYVRAMKEAVAGV